MAEKVGGNSCLSLGLVPTIVLRLHTASLSCDCPPVAKAGSVCLLTTCLPLPAASSCDQEHQSALEEAKQPKNDNVVIPECAHGGLYKPVQCHPSTGYCWCVLVDTGRPIPGTSTR